MTQENQQTQAQSQPIQNLEQMANLVIDWMENKHRKLNHIRDIPDTEKMVVEDQDTGEEIDLQGELRKVFLMGIAVAQTEFLEPPFKVVSDDEDTDDEQDD